MNITKHQVKVVAPPPTFVVEFTAAEFRQVLRGLGHIVDEDDARRTYCALRKAGAPNPFADKEWV